MTTAITVTNTYQKEPKNPHDNRTSEKGCVYTLFDKLQKDGEVNNIRA